MEEEYRMELEQRNEPDEEEVEIKVRRTEEQDKQIKEATNKIRRARDDPYEKKMGRR